jgi:hypothetical protein
LRYLLRFAPGALLLLLRQLRIFPAAAAAAARARDFPYLFGGEESTKKINCSVGVGAWTSLCRRGRGEGRVVAALYREALGLKAGDQRLLSRGLDPYLRKIIFL